MASTDPLDAQPAPTSRPVDLDRLVRVVRARWVIATITSQGGRDDPLVRANHRKGHPLARTERHTIGVHHVVPLPGVTFVETASRSQPTRPSKDTSITSGDATTTYAREGRRGISEIAARKRRLARFRATAEPTFLAATTPTSGTGDDDGASTTTMPPIRVRRPVRYTSVKREEGRSDT